MEFKPSEYQTKIFEWVNQFAVPMTGKHLIVRARAGTGKTKTGVEVFKILPDEMKPNSNFVAFNKGIAVELGRQLPMGANYMTYHSMGLKAIKKAYPRAKVDTDKVEKILKNRIGANQKFLIHPVKRLVGLCKNLLLTEVNDQSLYSMALDYDIDLYDEYSDESKYLIFQHVRHALSTCLTMTDLVDFDDMVWLPNVDDNVHPYQYDFLLVDELQDTNRAQMYLALNSISEGGSIIGVGDEKQSIYAFRGADSLAMSNFQMELSADELPLSLCYRCPTSVRDMVNREFPEIEFKTPEWAIEGSVSTISEFDLDKKIAENDMILCRVNADLVPVAFSLIRRGIKATIKGKDIGKSLITLVKRQRADDVPDLFIRLETFREAQYEKFIAMDKPEKILQLDDQIATLDVLSDGTTLVDVLLDRCDKMFSDERSAVTLSSVHKAKGLEAENVFVLRPDLLPHPRAKSGEQKIQESNLRYVAETRPKVNFNWVTK